MALLSTPSRTMSGEAAAAGAPPPDGSGLVLPRAEESRHPIPIAAARATTTARTKYAAMRKADDV
jgi:hypothetical protein